MKKNDWIGKALILGVVFFLAAFLVKPIGVSTQFSVLAGIVQTSVDSNIIVEDSNRATGYRSVNPYYDKDDGKLAKSIKEPFNYDFLFVLAIPLGGYLGSKLKKKGKKDTGEDNRKSCLLQEDNQHFIKRYGLSFLGGFLLLYGARMAGGCTSGHMMSGMMQGALSGYIFAGVVFLVAIPTAILTGRRKMKKER